MTRSASPLCVSLPPLLILTLLLALSTSAAYPPAASLPLGPSILGINEGYNSTIPSYPSPAIRADGFAQWLGWRPRWASQCLDFNQFTLYPSFFIQPFNLNATQAHITLQLPAMFQSSTTNTTWADAAAGKYDANWHTTGDQLCNVQQQCDVYLRFAWEMNGNWYPWSAGFNLTAYLSYYQHTVSAMRSVINSRFHFIWNPNANQQYGTGVLNPPWLAYPGDAYVDAIALDMYDSDYTTYANPNWQANKTQAQITAVWTSQWTKYQTGPYGLDDFLAFAKAHNKTLAICEWGLKPANGKGGGDNVVFVQAMYDWLTRPDVYPYVLYAAYFDELESAISQEPINPGNTMYPNATRLFKQLFGPSNPFWYNSSSAVSSSSSSTGSTGPQPDVIHGGTSTSTGNAATRSSMQMSSTAVLLAAVIAAIGMV